MKFSTTVIFTILFAVVAWFYVNRGSTPLRKGEQPAVDPAVSMKLLDVDSQESIHWIQIQNMNRRETVTLYREGALWMLKYPVRYQADAWAVEELLKILTLSFKVTEYEPKEDWESYGLLRPKIKIGIESKEWPNRRYLFLGDKAPVGDNLFARWEDKARYFLLEEAVLNAFSKSAYALRDKRIFRNSDQELKKIQIRIGGHIFELVKREEGWFWDKPDSIQGLSVGEKTMGDLMKRLNALAVKDFMDQENKKWSEFNLEPADSEIQIWTRTGTSEALRLGRELGVRHAYYGRREDEKVLFLVDRNLVIALLDTVVAMAGNLTEVSTGDLQLFTDSKSTEPNE